MYRKNNQQTIDDFILPFTADNRWVIKARLVPWDDIEGDYADLSKPARVALGALGNQGNAGANR